MMRNESSEKPLLSPDCVRAMDFANMCKQRLVLDLQLPALTGEIGGIHSKQGFSELSLLRTESSEKPLLSPNHAGAMDFANMRK